MSTVHRPIVGGEGYSDGYQPEEQASSGATNEVMPDIAAFQDAHFREALFDIASGVLSQDATEQERIRVSTYLERHIPKVMEVLDPKREDFIQQLFAILRITAVQFVVRTMPLLARSMVL